MHCHRLQDIQNKPISFIFSSLARKIGMFFGFSFEYRIVLERPEYGYATYFFELVDSLPVVWQIKRLVIAMKLTSCSRVSLIENKALRVPVLSTFSFSCSQHFDLMIR